MRRVEAGAGNPRRRADGRSVALAIVAVAPVAVVAVFAAGLYALFQLQHDTDREVGELAVQMDGIERRLARLKTGMELLLRHFQLVPPAEPQR